MSKTMPDVPINTTDGAYRDIKGNLYAGVGLTKLEYFAGKIMATLEGNDQHNTNKLGLDSYRTHTANAYMSVRAARALIAELNKESKSE